MFFGRKPPVINAWTHGRKSKSCRLIFEPLLLTSEDTAKVSLPNKRLQNIFGRCSLFVPWVIQRCEKRKCQKCGTSQLREIHPPFLLVYGEKDKHFHPYAKMLHQRLPKSELVFIKKVDHRIPTKAPGSLNKRIKQFVRRFSYWPPADENVVMYDAQIVSIHCLFFLNKKFGFKNACLEGVGGFLANI